MVANFSVQHKIQHVCIGCIRPGLGTKCTTCRMLWLPRLTDVKRHLLQHRDQQHLAMVSPLNLYQLYVLYGRTYLWNKAVFKLLLSSLLAFRRTLSSCSFNSPVTCSEFCYSQVMQLTKHTRHLIVRVEIFGERISIFFLNNFFLWANI